MTCTYNVMYSTGMIVPLVNSEYNGFLIDRGPLRKYG